MYSLPQCRIRVYRRGDSSDHSSGLSMRKSKVPLPSTERLPEAICIPLGRSRRYSTSASPFTVTVVGQPPRA